MREDSTQWDRQWSQLLTHAHGEDVVADAGLKSSLLQSLKEKVVARQADAAQEPVSHADDDRQWGALLSATYVPCYPDGDFKDELLKKMKARQAMAFGTTAMTATPAAAAAAVGAATPATTASPAETSVTTGDSADDSHEDEAIRTILSKSYKPVDARREFQTRLLENLKERQRRTADSRSRARRLAFYLSSASGVIAAALVIFVVWLSPTGQVMPEQRGNLRLTVPPVVADAAVDNDFRPSSQSLASSSFFPVQADNTYDSFQGSVIPASYEETLPAEFASYSVSDAFHGPVLPDRVSPHQNLQVNLGDGWFQADAGAQLALKPGMQFRASDSAMGHLEFPDGAIVTMSPASQLAATRDGLTVLQGFLLISVPLASKDRFRLHFPERDLAIEPGTDLAVMVESADKYAEGGAPAPMVMVVDRPDSPGGLALARGKNGVGPLLAKQLYHLDNYVTADLPSRILCDTECEDLNKLFKMETIRTAYPKASFAGGFAGDRDAGGNTAIVLTPAGFTKRGDQWVADTYNGQDTVKIRYLSDGYFGFANARRDLSRALSLGSNVIIDSGDGTFYEIFK
ncbi:MAG: hypothetical protein LUG50_11745 [Planctomycetaceae bacterium]|nr:hypothetical protein [Planctomycetaceae bacterium]